jgi:hypothetical protein
MFFSGGPESPAQIVHIAQRRDSQNVQNDNGCKCEKCKAGPGEGSETAVRQTPPFFRGVNRFFLTKRWIYIIIKIAQ